MRNSRRIKMITWIMTAIMLLCTMPVAAMAAGSVTDTFTFTNVKSGTFILNKSADCDVFYTKDNQVYEDLSGAVAGQDYVMELSVSGKGDTPLPNTALYFELPEEVYSVVDGSNSDVSWKKENNYLVFNWTTEDAKNAFEAQVFIMTCEEYDLYNIAKFDGKYYRMAKTKITVIKSLDEYIKGKANGVDNPVANTEYTAAEYEFGDITKDDGVVYVYRPDEFKPNPNETIFYYKAKLVNVTAVRNKIGGMNGNNPRWINGEKQYDDPNTTNCFHRNYELTFYTQVGYAEYPLMNFLRVINNKKEVYYRLKIGSIQAADPATNPYTYGKDIDTSKYVIDGEYDFSNVVLHIDGIDYVYSDHKLEGNYRSYFTVSFTRVCLQNRVNGDDAWYRNPMGFLDESQSQYHNMLNQTVAYHRDYTATLHKGTLPDYGVTITSSLAGKTEVLEGTMITLTGTPIGFDNTPYSIRWERKDPATGNVEVIEGQNSLTYTFPITEETSKYDYYIILTPVE